MLLTFLAISCNQNGSVDAKEQQLVSRMVILDVSDAKKLKLWPAFKAILKSYNLDKNPKMAAWLGIRLISDLRTNPSNSIFLPDNNETEKLNHRDDVQWRKRCIVRFYDSAKSIIDNLKPQYDNCHKSYSECWATISEGLSILSKQPGHDKRLFIYSDLEEQSLIGSAYKNFKTLDATAIANTLIKSKPVDCDINGIEVIIIYQPHENDRADDQRFNKMVDVYRKIIEPLGGLLKVTTDSNEIN
jgi:hypothetical protein